MQQAQKQPSKGLLENSYSALVIKNLEFYCEGVHFFTEVAGCRPENLLKMNPFARIFQGF